MDRVEEREDDGLPRFSFSPPPAAMSKMPECLARAQI